MTQAVPLCLTRAGTDEAGDPLTPVSPRIDICGLGRTRHDGASQTPRWRTQKTHDLPLRPTPEKFAR